MEYDRSLDPHTQTAQPNTERGGIVLNFLDRHQTWSAKVTAQADARFAPRMQRLEAREARQITRMQQRNELDQLRLGALVEPETYERPLREAENTYHLDRAEHMASYLTAVATEQPRFAGIKRRFGEVRQSYHLRKARKAANRLLMMV